MKTLMSFFGLVLFSSIYVGNTNFLNTEISYIVDKEKVYEKDIMEYLEETEEALIEVTEDLSEEQMQYKPDAESWSIAEIIEHINMVENSMKSMINNKMNSDSERENIEVKMTDDQVIQLITNRSQKFKTQNQFEPTGEYTTADDAIKAFIDQRENITDWIKDSNTDMRSVVITDFPFGPVDGYQTLLFMAGHTERHTAQIEEVKASPDFPEE